jgi:hypothetical protein
MGGLIGFGWIDKHQSTSDTKLVHARAAGKRSFDSFWPKNYKQGVE